MSALDMKVAEEAADIAWEQHAANMGLVRRVMLDANASDEQRRRALEMAARSERTFKDRFLALDASPRGDDGAIVRAWTDWRDQRLDNRDEDAPAQLERMTECGRYFAETPASTPLGVAKQLRALLWTTSAQSPWLEMVALEANVSDFTERMDLADFTAQITWNAIVALERMGGAA